MYAISIIITETFILTTRENNFKHALLHFRTSLNNPELISTKFEQIKYVTDKDVARATKTIYWHNKQGKGIG